MHFVPLYELASGMELARDLHLFDKKSNKVKLLRKNAILNEDYISKLKDIGVSGAYIRDGIADDIEVKNLINDQEKVRTVFEIKQLFDAVDSTGNDLQEEDIDKMKDIVAGLIKTIADTDSIRIGISDIKSYDEYTYYHSLAVAVSSLALGKQLNLNDEDMEKLGLAAILHDLGKVELPIELVNKRGKLTDEELGEMQTHAMRGGDYLLSRGLVENDVYQAIICHHERWNGNGYPLHLKGTEIPYLARIIAVADVYDALTSKRPYRDPMSPNDAYEYITGGVGTHFDYSVVEAFIHCIEPYPLGACVKLSNGELGIVIDNRFDIPIRPMVRSLNGDVVYDLYNDASLINVTILGIYGEITEEEIIED